MPQFQNSFSVGDVVNLLIFVVALSGVFLTLKQMRENAKTEKASFFKDLYTTMFADPEIRNAYYQIEYEDFKYDESFHGSSNERQVDRLLSFVNLVCDLHAQNILTSHEMSFFKYQFIRIYSNRNIKGYLNFLEGFYSTTGTDTKPFASFKAYCEEAITPAR